MISSKPSGVTRIPRVGIEARLVDTLVRDTELGEEDVEWSHIRYQDVQRIVSKAINHTLVPGICGAI